MANVMGGSNNSSANKPLSVTAKVAEEMGKVSSELEHDLARELVERHKKRLLPSLVAIYDWVVKTEIEYVKQDKPDVITLTRSGSPAREEFSPGKIKALKDMQEKIEKAKRLFEAGIKHDATEKDITDAIQFANSIAQKQHQSGKSSGDGAGSSSSGDGSGAA